MKIFLFTLLLLHLCFNFAIATYGSWYEETTNPKSCGLQLALDGAWTKSGKQIILEPYAPMYSFDANNHKCIKYNRGFLGNNDNSFYTEKACIKLCRPWNLERPAEKDMDYIVTEDDDGNPTDPKVCGWQTALDGEWIIDDDTGKLEKLDGLLLAPRYSFHANTNDCIKFNAGGFGNNKNAFVHKKACLKLCRKWNIERSKSDLEEYHEGIGK